MSSQGLSASHSPLATAHQAEVERTALGLLQRPDIKLAHLQAKALFLADPVAMTPAGSRCVAVGSAPGRLAMAARSSAAPT